ncbi:MAG: serine/threonine protein kinase [Calditrichaeota bacterium]|nr:MAG: serine/threonine protein kinase [Calditrichota bacterium]
MNAKRWKQIEELFAAALGISDEQQDYFLREKCGEDRELYDEVKSLLDEDKNMHSLLYESPVSPLFEFSSDAQYIGKNLGVYHIEKQIASGGMGAVFLASRNDGLYEQKVALKIIHSGLKSASFLQRFERERQILAGLNHPNIAYLLDGGISKEGTPYLVMEYVDGKPFDVFVREKKLRISERLRLFMKVCEAVIYAHNHLVIHRDLKPGNIFVTEEGQVKLLDFGIAKVLSAEDNTPEMHTMIEGGVIPFTPEYASPEQIEGKNISTVSDVYSLGVLLYELLCGQRPYQFKTKTLLEMQQVLQNTVAQKPSIAIKKATENSEDAHSWLLPITPARILKGDLDNICLKMLKKEPELRYHSVELVKMDIERYLAGLPVSAANDNFTYRVSKFIGRHKLAVGLTASFITALTVVSIFYTLQLQQETKRAQQEAKKTGQVAEFLKSLFETASPEGSRGKIFTAVDLLEAGAKNVENSLFEQPDVQAEMFAIIGDVNRRIGRYAEAETMENKSLERNLTFFGARSEAVARNYFNLGNLYYDLGQYERSENNLMEALNLRNFVRTEADFFYSDVLAGLADVEYQNRDYIRSDSLFAAAQAILERSANSESVRGAAIFNARAAIARRLGKFDQASKLYQKTLALRKSLLGSDHADVAHTLNHIGRLYYMQGKFSDAEAYAREGLALREKIFGENHQETGASLSNLANILKSSGRLKEAEKYYRRSFNAFMKVVGENHQYAGSLSYNLGMTLYELGRLKDAEDKLRLAIRINDKQLSPEHAIHVNSRIALGRLLTDENQTDEAYTLLQYAYKLSRENNGEQHKTTALAASEMGHCLLKMGNFDLAENRLTAAIAILKKENAEEQNLQRSLKYLRQLYKITGNLAQLRALD